MNKKRTEANITSRLQTCSNGKTNEVTVGYAVKEDSILIKPLDWLE